MPTDFSTYSIDNTGEAGILLKSLRRKQAQMYADYERITIESGYREAVPESRQTHKDFWLYSFAKQLEYCDLSKKEKIPLLQALLDTFEINNPMSAMEYYTAIAANSRYIAYINNCFESKRDKAGLFWSVLGSMSGNEGQRINKTIQYTTDYFTFMQDLERYLQRIFEGAGFGGHLYGYISMLTNSISYTTNHLEEIMPEYTTDTENPLY